MSKPEKSKSFKYNLLSVLKVRQIHEKQEQEKFQVAERKFDEEKKKEDKIKDFQKQKYHELRELFGSGEVISDFHEVLMRKSHLDIVKEQVQEQERLRQEAERLKDEQRQRLIKAAIDKKIMEKDQEKKKIAWKGVMEKEETKFFDDISSIRFHQQKREKEG